MKIKFTKDTEIEVVTGYDKKNDDIVTENEFFKVGEIHDVDLLEDLGDAGINIQFGCGDCAYNVSKSCFEIIQTD